MEMENIASFIEVWLHEIVGDKNSIFGDLCKTTASKGMHTLMPS